MGLSIGEDRNPADKQHSDADKREQLEYSVKRCWLPETS